VLTLTGTLLAGKYRVRGRLGSGGMGEVYEAVQEDLGRRVAIKVMSGPMASDPQLLERFQREARAVAALGHPHIVAVTDFQDNPGEPPFLVMERLVGESLGDILERDPMIEPKRACRIAEQTLSALAAAHEAGLVHRDVKPDNIFICNTDTGAEIVKLLDFGVAKALEEGPSKLTSTGAVVGTLVYMAPEQARGETIDARADVYALGAVLYHMLAGQTPFPATNAARLLSAVCSESPMPLSSLRPDLDGDLVAIVARAMARDAPQRFATARAMMNALGTFLRGEKYKTDPMSATALAQPAGHGYTTGAPIPFSGTPVPSQPVPQTPHPHTPQHYVVQSAPPPSPYMHPGSGGGVVVPPYGVVPSSAAPSSSRSGIWIGLGLLLVSLVGAGSVVVYMRVRRAHTATIALTTTATVNAPATVDLVAATAQGGDISSLAPLGSNAPPNATSTTSLVATNAPPSTINASPNPAMNGATTAQLAGIMTKAHMSGDGKTCLDAYDKLRAQPDFSDPANGYAFIHGDCLMSAGRCDEGRRVLRDYWNSPRPIMQQMTAQQIDQTVSSMAEMYCPVSQLSAAERAQRAQTLLYRAQSSKDTAGAARQADEIAAQIPALPAGNEEERRKLIGYQFMIGKAYAEAGRCADAKRHFHAECMLTSPANSDACAASLLSSQAGCKTGP
jgi:serine/threonine protein kinase